MSPDLATTTPAAEAVAGVDWAAVGAELDDLGGADLGPLLDQAACARVAALDDEPHRFRSTVDMARHRFGRGRYGYFAHPLPPEVVALRAALWPHLLPLAREWAERLGRPAPWPDAFGDWLHACQAAGQTRPTPLLLTYGPGDWNALHRDLYGDLVFPLQVVVGLDRPGVDYTGGELVLVEQRPRAQSRATTFPLLQGHGVVVTTEHRPLRTARGWSRAPVRHGVSVVRSGRRRTLGLLFHDAA
ncbi:2OG-Fe(II) oxygenase [Iamia sp. SCSIO 61187]|uniref:2OG-Fe(II) oxygenase n=1 Tax=Iamia sp. SCSIO 61187 TaxID=2722752 RepID=UPI001C63883B|nr:2OG-Fe(II) oxygenase [Iamia sp. SCSIO 61187]QYG91084.1 2OG-Fe(II) oxygenase [Iamia sp. SCSIO 61187]